MQVEKTRLKELMHADFPIMMAELTDYGESLKKLPWSKEEFNFNPYCVFVRKNDQLYYYYDQDGINWKTEQAGKFDKDIMAKKTLEGFDAIKNVILKEKALNLKELKKFTDTMKKYFTWWDCMWWMIEYYDKNGLPLEDVISIRKKTEYISPGTNAVLRKSASKIYKDKKDFVDVLTLKEVLSGGIPSDRELIKRTKECAFTNGKIYNSFSEIVKEYGVEIEEDKFSENESELKGQVAFPGKVKGRVRILNSREDVKKLEKGEILVAGTTTPDFFPAMKKSAAIISEHGGAISHAAITSRELKIPCIVGTKHATQVLKDGDEVEVDADKGIVRIIKKAE